MRPVFKIVLRVYVKKISLATYVPTYRYRYRYRYASKCTYIPYLLRVEVFN
jgi:hypothetical protein